MSHTIRRLVWRLGHPHVASRLAKEELCLSLGAIARLTPFGSGECPEMGDALLQRARRAARACSPREIGMIAQGSACLKWGDAALLELLVDQMYVALRNREGRLSDVTAVAVAATAPHGGAPLANLTLHSLVLRAGELVKDRDVPATIHELLDVAPLILTETELKTFHERLEEAVKSRGSPGAQAALAARTKGTAPAPAPRPPGGSEHEVPPSGAAATWTAARARTFLVDAVLRETECGPREVSSRLEMYGHFAITDEVLQEALQRMAIAALPSCTARELQSVKKAAYAKPGLFPLLRAELTNMGAVVEEAPGGGDSGTALRPASAVFQSYQRRLHGRRVPEEMVLHMLSDLAQWSPDEMAQIAFALSDRQGYTEDFVALLMAQTERLSHQGLVALLRAAHSDASGSLLAMSERAMRAAVAEASLTTADLDTLRELGAVLAAPLPRGATSICPGAAEAKRELTRALLQHLPAILPRSCFVSELCAIGSHFAAIDADGELYDTLCDRLLHALPRGPDHAVGLDDALCILDLLVAFDRIHERLIDSILPSLRAVVTTLTRHVADGEVVQPDGVACVTRVMLGQLKLHAPELESSLSTVVHCAEQHREQMPDGLLPVLLLASAAEGRRHLTRHLLGAVGAKLLDGTLPVHDGGVEAALDAVVWGLADVLRPCEAEAVQEERGQLVRGVAQWYASRLGAALAEGLSPHQPPPMNPTTLALVLAAHARHCGGQKPPEVVVDFVMEWLGGVSPAAYTELATAVAHFDPPQEDLSNALIDALPLVLDRLQPRQIADCVFGFGEVPGVGLRLSHQLAVEPTSDYVVDHAEMFWSGGHIARMLFGFSRMQCTKRSLYNVFAGRLSIRSVTYAMSQEAVSLAINAFGNAKYLDKKLFDRLSLRSIQVARQLNAADITLTVHGYSRVMLLNRTLYAELGERAVEIATDFTPSAACTLIESYGSLGVAHDNMATKLLGVLADKVEALDVNRLTRLLTALWQMDYPLQETGQFEKLAGLIARNAEGLSEQSILALCSVMQDTSWRHSQLLVAIADHAAARGEHDEISPESSRVVLDTLGQFLIHHEKARDKLSTLARSVSKEHVQLSEEEQEQLRLLIQR